MADSFRPFVLAYFLTAVVSCGCARIDISSTPLAGSGPAAGTEETNESGTHGVALASDERDDHAGLNHALHQIEETGLDHNRAANVLVQISIEGNQTIPDRQVLPHIRSRSGRQANGKLIREDVERLLKTRWFVDVKDELRSSPQGKILVFHVVERPVVTEVIYRGNKKIKMKDLRALGGLRKGSPMDPSLNRQIATRIEEHYRSKGHTFARVELTEGGNAGDRRVVFDIDEGDKVRVTSVAIEGNEFFSDGLLKTKIQTKPRRFFFFGGKYRSSVVDDDAHRLEAYYKNLGFFDATVTPERRSDDRDYSNMHVTFFVKEGQRYRVREVQFEGNERIPEEQLRADLALEPGEYFNQFQLRKDVQRMQEMYGALGHYYASINPEPIFEVQDGVLDVLYSINEREPIRIRRVNVVIQGDNPRTKESVVRNLLTFRPGDLLDPAKLRRSEQRLSNSQLFQTDPVKGGPRVEVVEPGPAPATVTRAQYGDGEPDVLAQQDGPPIDPYADPLDIPPPGERDILITGSEAQTGRFMVGAGVDSNSGVLGSIVLHERNFDILRTPRSFSDILDGTAWRGDGQEFRLEALPGSRVSRYMISFREPYLFDLPISFGVSAHYFQRFFQDWDEQRTGGRFSLGRALTDEIAITGSLRLENVEISDPDVPTPPDLAAVLGDTFLGVARFAISHDTRDSPFMPTEGHFVELAYEQGFGDFTFPRGTVEGRQYFMLRERPDGTGRQVLGLRALAGVTGSDTPIYDRFFAGGFQTLRGFDYRGAGPRVFDVRVGGEFELLGSAEYKVPLTADDTLQGVVFVDAGTVEESVKITSDFRVALGAGLRIQLPMMGPAPIALDFAIPVARADEDDIQVFSFWIGFLR